MAILLSQISICIYHTSEVLEMFYPFNFLCINLYLQPAFCFVRYALGVFHIFFHSIIFCYYIYIVHHFLYYLFTTYQYCFVICKSQWFDHVYLNLCLMSDVVLSSLFYQTLNSKENHCFIRGWIARKCVQLVQSHRPLTFNLILLIWQKWFAVCVCTR